MNGLSVMKRTASTSSSIFAVSSAITFLSGKPMPAVIDRSLSYRRWSPALPHICARLGPGDPVTTDGDKSTGPISRSPCCRLLDARFRERGKPRTLTSHHFPLDRLPAAEDQRLLIRSLD